MEFLVLVIDTVHPLAGLLYELDDMASVITLFQAFVIF